MCTAVSNTIFSKLMSIISYFCSLFATGRKSQSSAESASESRKSRNVDFDGGITQLSVDVEKLLGVTAKEFARRIYLHPVTYKEQVPLHTRKRYIALKKEEEVKISAELLRQAKAADLFYDDRDALARAEGILRKISTASPIAFAAEVSLGDSDTAASYSLPSGQLIVTRGMLEQFSEDELAFVLAHEYSYALARHDAECFTEAVLYLDLQRCNPLDYPLSNGRLTTDLARGLVSSFGVKLPYSMTSAQEADALAVVLMNKAGYQVNAALSALKKLACAAHPGRTWDAMLAQDSELKQRRDRLEQVVNARAIQEDIVEKGQDITLDATYDDAIKVLDDMDFAGQPCSFAVGDVLFVPGILMADPKNYFPMLQKVYPNRNLQVVKWTSISKKEFYLKMVTTAWDTAVYRTDFAAFHLAQGLLERSAKSLSKLVLVGHSLGVQIALKVAGILAANGVKVEKVVLLGGAVNADTDLLANSIKISREQPWNFYHPYDAVLGLLYTNKEGARALGQIGASKKSKGLSEFHVVMSNLPKSVDDNSIIDTHVASTYCEAFAQADLHNMSADTAEENWYLYALPESCPAFKIPASGAIIHDNLKGWSFREYRGAMLLNITGYAVLNPYEEPCKTGSSRKEIEGQWEIIKGKLQGKKA